MSEPSYEFTLEQNETIRQLATKMSAVGTFLLVVGMLSIAWAILGTTRGDGGTVVAALGLAAYFSVTGLLTLRSRRSFHRIVETEGDDIAHTMAAIDTLRRCYAIKFWLVVAALALVLLSIPAS